MPASDLDGAEFTSVDWEEISTGRTLPSGRTLGLAAAFAVVAVLYIYDYSVGPERLLFDWSPTRADWLFVVSIVLTVRYIVVPMVTNRGRTVRHIRTLRRRPAAVLSIAFIVTFVVLGLLRPDTWFVREYPRLEHRLQPPVFTSVFVGDQYFYTCVGELVGEHCHGTWQYPLGTTRFGENIIKLLVSGMQVGLMVGLTTAVIMAVVATAVGTAAGYFGGWVDHVLMGYVDVQQTVPAIIVYILLATLFFGSFEGVSDGGLFAFVLVFGLLDWGGIARAVRSDVLTRRSAGYVHAAAAAGASDLHIIRRHLIPNSISTIVTEFTRHIPLLILAQVALAYLELNRIDSKSLGRLLRIGLENEGMAWSQKWWVTAFAVVVLVLTVVSFNVLGDVLRDILDPQREGR